MTLSDGLPGPGFLRVLDNRTIMLPDRMGNNRLDALRNVTVNPRVALLCLVPGIDETLRIYGGAELRPTADAKVEVTEHGRPRRSVMVVSVDRALLHCPGEPGGHAPPLCHAAMTRPGAASTTR